MTEISAPWDGIVTGDATAAPYSASEWSAIWQALFRASKTDEGPILGSGVSPDPGLTVQATAVPSATVNVTAGAALVRGTWYSSSATVNLPIGANATGNPRIDTIILRKDYAAQTIRLVVLPGVAAVSPTPPALTQTDGVTWEIPLADIDVASGFVSIAQGDITPNRHWANAADGVYVEDVYNGGAGTLYTGDVVVWRTATDRAAITSTTLGDPNVAGVWVGRTVSGGYGRMLVKGIGYVNVSGAASRGDILVPLTSRYAKAAASAATASKRNSVGVALENKGAGLGQILAMIDIGAQRPGAIVSVNTGGAGNTNSITFVDVNAADVITITTHTGRVRVTAHIQGYVDAGTGYWDIYSVGLTARAGNATTGLQNTAETGVHGQAMTLVGIFTGLATGVAQTFSLQHRAENPNNVYTLASIVMYAEEI